MEIKSFKIYLLLLFFGTNETSSSFWEPEIYV